MNRCPRCAKGKVFTGLFKMNTSCPDCGLQYLRDLSGARWLSYYPGLLLVAPVFLYTLLKEWPLPQVIGLSALLALLVTPLTVRLTTLAAVRIDYRLNKGRGD